MTRARWGAIARIRQAARVASGAGPASSPPPGGADDRLSDQAAELRARIAHLEQLVQGLQDSVHRASERQDKRLSDIERRLDPAMLAAALSQDARSRGL